MNKELVINTIIGGLAATIVTYLYCKNKYEKSMKDEQQKSECAMEFLIRSSANNNVTAKEMYKSIYGKDPVRGISALEYCK